MADSVLPTPTKIDVKPVKLAVWLTETAIGLTVIGIVAIGIEHAMQRKYGWWQRITKGSEGHGEKPKAEAPTINSRYAFSFAASLSLA